MKKYVIIVAGIVVLIGLGVGGYVLVLKDDPAPTQPDINAAVKSRPSSEVENQKDNTSPAPVSNGGNEACARFSLDSAKKLIGSSAVAAKSNEEPAKDTNNIRISVCEYTADNKIASVLMRVAKNTEGAQGDKDQFGQFKPDYYPNVSGYGEAAYWNSDFAELNILKDGTWYIIKNGSSTVSERKVDDSKKLADTLKLAN